MSMSDVVDRASYIFGAYEDDSVAIINDPNFLTDCYILANSGKGNLLAELSKVFSVKLFSVHRDFASYVSSLAKMRFGLGEKNASSIIGKDVPIRNLMVLPLLLDTFDIVDFPVYDMEFVTSRTSAFVKDLFVSHGLGDLRGITMPSCDNPNPANKIDSSSIANHLKLLEQRWKHFDNPAGIHQKIKVSSSEYANALRQMHQTWQQ